MKITKVDTVLVRIPRRHDGPPSGFGGRIWTTIDTLLVRVDTEDGLSGWGEAFGYNVNEGTKATIDTLIGPLCIGRDSTAIAQLMAELQQTLHFFGRPFGGLPPGAGALEDEASDDLVRGVKRCAGAGEGLREIGGHYPALFRGGKRFFGMQLDRLNYGSRHLE